MLTIKGFITNLGKYNEGELVGKWVDFPISEDELNEVLQEIGCKYFDYENEQYINEGYEEFFFTDWETDFDNNFGEYESIDNINELAEKLADWEEDLFSAACEIWNVNEVLENDPDDYYLLVEVNGDYDLGYYWIEESGCYDLSNLGNLAYYIDYEKFGRDVRLETSGGFTRYGWVEYRG